MRQLVGSEEEIAQNCSYFSNKIARRDPRALDLLRRGHNFVIAETNDGLMFVPSRFVGYAKNNFPAHEKEEKDGKQTDPAVSRILGSRPKMSSDRESDYKDLIERYELKLQNRVRLFWDSLISIRDKKTGGIRSAATWEDHEGPLRKKISSILDKLGCSKADGHPWLPDVIKKTSFGKILIVEIKPDAGIHNLLTALGQSICYRSITSDFISIIAASGIKEIGNELSKILRECSIFTVDLANIDSGDDVEKQFKHIIDTSSKKSRPARRES